MVLSPGRWKELFRNSDSQRTKTVVVHTSDDDNVEFLSLHDIGDQGSTQIHFFTIACRRSIALSH